MSRLPVYDSDEERRLFRRARTGDRAALTAVTRAHLRFVVDVALDRRGWNVPVERLIGAGNRGLMWAAREFDPEGTESFLDYARACVRAEMRKLLEVR